jgi:hypothetical protein
MVWRKVPDWVADRLSGPAVKTYLVILRLSNGKPARIPLRLIAARREQDMRTMRNHLREMYSAGVLRVVRTVIAKHKNAHNLYILLDIDGSDLHLQKPKNFRQKPVQILKKTKTPLARSVERREHNHPPALRALHEYNGRLMDENRGLRLILKSRTEGHPETEAEREAREQRQREREESNRWVESLHEQASEVVRNRMLAAGWQLIEGRWRCPVTSVMA